MATEIGLVTADYTGTPSMSSKGPEERREEGREESALQTDRQITDIE